MNKLTVLINNESHDLLVANCALNVRDAYTVMVGLDPIPLIELLSTNYGHIQTSIGIFPMRYYDKQLQVSLIDDWLEIERLLPYIGKTTQIISEYDFYNKYINQTC